MFDKEYLSSSEKLSAFLDGELPQEDVHSLFYEIASDAELQEELRTLVSVKEMTKSSMMMPPPALKSSLDSRLGFSNDKPIAMESSAKKSAAAGFFGNRFFLSSMAAIMSAVIMYFVMLPTQQIDTNTVKIADNKTEITTSDTKEAAIPVVNSVENDYSQTSNNHINNQTRVTRTDEVPQQTSMFTSNIFNDETSSNVESESTPNRNNYLPIKSVQLADIDYADFETQMPVLTFDRQANFSKDPASFVMQEPNTEILNKFSLEMRYNQGKSYPNLDIPVEAEPIINNVAVGLFYKYNEFNSIGIEFGQENYYQRFFFKEGELVKRYEQNWMAFWGGITYNHDFDKIDLYTPLYPYYRFLIGGTQIGPMFRTSLGVKLPVSDKMHFVLATEGSYMVYHFQGRSYSSSRLGLSLGFSFGL